MQFTTFEQVANSRGLSYHHRQCYQIDRSCLSKNYDKICILELVCKQKADKDFNYDEEKKKSRKPSNKQ